MKARLFFIAVGVISAACLLIAYARCDEAGGTMQYVTRFYQQCKVSK